MNNTKYIGMDVHQATISVAVHMISVHPVCAMIRS
jgi:hypothetical protein